MNKFHLSMRSRSNPLFMFAGAIAAGTIIGGPIGDRIGRKSSSGAPSLECCRSPWCCRTRICSGQRPQRGDRRDSRIGLFRDFGVRSGLMPGKIGMVSGMFFGLAFGMAGVGAALLGNLADHTSIGFVYKVCSSCRPSACLPDSCRIWKPDTSSHHARDRRRRPLSRQQLLAHGWAPAFHQYDIRASARPFGHRSRTHHAKPCAPVQRECLRCSRGDCRA